MLSNTPPTYLGKKRRTGPLDFHINKMRALGLSTAYMNKLREEARGSSKLTANYNQLPAEVLKQIGDMGARELSVLDKRSKKIGDEARKDVVCARHGKHTNVSNLSLMEAATIAADAMDW